MREFNKTQMIKQQKSYAQKSNTTGFTLIEIIVVLIILGVLAALAIPSYFTWIRRSQAAEAIVSMKQINDRIQACAAAAGFADASKDKCFSSLAQGTTGNFSYNFPSSVIQTNLGPMPWASGAYTFFMEPLIAIPNDPCVSPGCSLPNVCEQPSILGRGRSGIQICHHSNGTIELTGYGIFKGI